MAESLCLTRDSNIFDQIVPDQDDLFLGPTAGEGPEGPAPKRSQPWLIKQHVSIIRSCGRVQRFEQIYRVTPLTHLILTTEYSRKPF